MLLYSSVAASLAHIATVGTDLHTATAQRDLFEQAPHNNTISAVLSSSQNPENFRVALYSSILSPSAPGTLLRTRSISSCADGSFPILVVGLGLGLGARYRVLDLQGRARTI